MWRRRARLLGVAMRQARRYPLRSLLVVGCAAMGVAGAVTAVNYASAGRQQVLQQIQKLGTNVVTISAEQSRNVAGRARTGAIVTTLQQGDHAALRREIPDILRASAVATTGQRLKGNGQSKFAAVVGVEPSYFPIRNWTIAHGMAFDAADQRRAARVALLGATLARDLFGDSSPVGERLFINRIPFEIVGVLRERGPGLDAVDEDQQVYVPLSAAMRRVMNVDHYSSLVLEIADWRSMDRTSAAIGDLLRERHRIRAGQQDDFRVLNQKTLVDAQLQAASQLGFFVRWIGLSALMMSGLGVLAMAWIAVRDRTREIGTRRALGATAADVFLQFAGEAVTLAAFGAIAGLGLGWGLSRLVAARAQLPFVFEVDAAALALLAALLLNVLFASWPALRAARLDPIAALRHE